MVLSSIFNSDISEILQRCKSAILGFGIKDLIEIILLSGIIFLVFQLLKGRKAGALAMGIVVLTLLLIISRIFEFTVLYKFFSSILGSGIVVIIIIFQPEIREALEKIGNGSLRGIMSISERKKNKEKYIGVIDDICAAVTELSKDSTGALIVIERTMSLSDVVKMGVVINSDVNDLLLRNIFYNRAPLHDGAVVISGEKIVAASCFLPLTERTDLDNSFGTRHRAAIGMAERSDAVIIVVSEETGSISIAYESTLMRNVTPVELKGFLHENVLKIHTNTQDK